jgi:sulfate adenylyltransferase
MHVLFVCTGNICRSAYAELYARHAFGGDLVVASAGTHAMPAWPMDDDMAAQLPDEVDVSGFRSRQVTRAHVARADLVLTATARHRKYLLDEFPREHAKLFTFGQAAAAARAVGSGLSAGEELGRLVEHRGPSSAHLDVDDPYGFGPDAARLCAERLRADLDLILSLF